MPRYPKGLSKGVKGWRISLGPGGRTFTKRYPPETPQADVEADLSKARSRMGAGRVAPEGTFAHDVQTYLASYYHGKPGYEERARHLGLWTDRLGAQVRRADVTRENVARVLQAWRSAGLAADTCNKRRTALLAFYHALDGKSGRNPVREVPKFRGAPPLPRAMPYDLITKAFRKMPKCKTRARLKVMAYTGARPIQLRQLEPDDWDEKHATLLLKSTDKGHGTRPHRVPLSAEGQAAMREFEDTDAWGMFQSAPMARMWKAAAVRVKLPPSVVPYDLRHSYGTKIYAATGDIRITKELMGHASIAMTERYTLTGISDAERVAILKAFPAKVGTTVGTRKKRA